MTCIGNVPICFVFVMETIMNIDSSYSLLKLAGYIYVSSGVTSILCKHHVVSIVDSVVNYGM